MDKEWQASNDLSTLHQAAQIKQDKKRFKAAQALMKKTVISMDMMAGVPDKMKPKKGKRN